MSLAKPCCDQKQASGRVPKPRHASDSTQCMSWFSRRFWFSRLTQKISPNFLIDFQNNPIITLKEE
jgi:hypothetical protein